MPAALKVDWSLIKAAFLAGVETNVIAEKFGGTTQSIYKRASRHGWNEERCKLEELRALNTRQDEKQLVLSKGVQSLSEVMNYNRDEFLKAGGNVVMKATKRLNKIVEDESESMDLDGLGNVGAVAESLARAGKPIFGLGDGDKVNVGVQVAVLSSLDEIPDVQVTTNK